MKVNGQDAAPGCYIAGHHGQYGIDGLADICGQFGIELAEKDYPAYWRELAESEELTPSTPQFYWEQWADTGTTLEDTLNNATEGGYWSWEDGEFFLTQTEVEVVLWAHAEEGDDYEDVWRRLIEGGIDFAHDYVDLDRGERAFRFLATIHYEPEDQ